MSEQIPSTPSTDASADVSENAYQIMRNAVNLARNENIRTAKRLRERLLEIHPGMEADIEDGLKIWANYLKKRGIEDYIHGW